MQDVKIYQKTRKGCVYKCQSCHKWHLIYKSIQFDFSEDELFEFLNIIQENIEILDGNSDLHLPVIYSSECSGKVFVNFIEKEYMEIEYLVGSTLALLNAERILENA